MKRQLPVAKTQIPQTFNQIAHRYDFLNHLLSFGVDKYWRNKMVDALPKDNNNLTILDLATGTGDVAIQFAQKYPGIKKIIGCDPADNMMAIGEKKVRRLNLSHLIEFKSGNAHNLPFADESFDVVSMAFGLRNIPDMERGLSEIHRVLRRGGRAIILEFSIPENTIVKGPYLLYFKHILPAVGGIVSRNHKAYKYLNQSVEDFPMVSEIKFKMEKNKLAVYARPLSFGIATLYVATKT
ncbi:MAG: bifunctional demethylmenaquinone methyltransferase/2-methoxy-6-polyprenyl-1,4-benzoquinol methylase [Bdellovibrionales bacterium RIFOXYD12_FULL_39_22]|nr:MAG: bifunctional demethylmenaquinone methyltransferase/2-methoxy-6-polyprenyl-1,4-benzoquinol methylase [Bdellovibrionales bacterium RIFOXYB1_FULL_39_21]OFZ42116.1 MAG: bifunctional demethylmenaquinone methyltransferase/2-methoxy-6-polyprenyl-1,4-benzoquinol methylase [Bdellovibrionales bacterium RIFOXYC12_FULL_39_17]OFZ50832.1 MAG: bifunctional demethylmenaquinone methyltransferase/2-methoxy-6-polyprenyl-1,4-benzoquinol methylase [Bdellovibrionales bacterium RIFOXYC1_FULL_39_130]OFZ78055.1 